MSRCLLVATLFLTLATAGRARANDSAALLEAGGIVLAKSDDVVMESEDLWVSKDLIRVTYVFRNTGQADVRTRVAFPLPGIPTCKDDAQGECDVDMKIGPYPNPMHFKLAVDGKRTKFRTEKKVEMKGDVGTTWVTHHWEQLFARNRPVKIVHEYVPVAGGFFSDTGGYSEGRFERDMAETYCVGPKLLAALKSREQFLWVVHYILTTGANWKGPIGTFKLTIAKNSPKDKVSVCLPDTRKTSPLTFEVVRHDFVPTQDLKVLFILDKW